ncbi:MAG: YeeE/YedE family protein [Dehalococcoidia bacterium]
MIFTAIPVGLVFGFALSRGRFCMNSAFRDIIVLKDYTLLKAVALAILVSMIGFAIMDRTGVISVSPVTFWWGANMLGGFIFGIGMVLAGGCASGITYRTGEGMVSAMVAVVGLTFFGLLTSMGVFNPFIDSLRSATTVTLSDGANLTLANVFGIPYYILALAIAGVALILWAIFGKKGEKASESVSLNDKIFKQGWDWKFTGIVIGLIGIAAFYTSTIAGRSYPLAITGGYLSTAKSLIMGENLMTWLPIMVMSTIVGAFLAAIISGEFKLRAPAPKTLIQCFIGGCLMGFGAVCSGGCNITHILSGVPQLALSSMLGGAFIILGCWATAWWMFLRPMREL